MLKEISIIIIIIIIIIIAYYNYYYCVVVDRSLSDHVPDHKITI